MVQDDHFHFFIQYIRIKIYKVYRSLISLSDGPISPWLNTQWMVRGQMYSSCKDNADRTEWQIEHTSIARTNECRTQPQNSRGLCNALLHNTQCALCNSESMITIVKVFMTSNMIRIWETSKQQRTVQQQVTVPTALARARRPIAGRMQPLMNCLEDDMLMMQCVYDREH